MVLSFRHCFVYRFVVSGDQAPVSAYGCPNRNRLWCGKRQIVEGARLALPTSVVVCPVRAVTTARGLTRFLVFSER
jgi:hypothetical protein